MSYDVRVVNLSDIKPNPVALRTVDRESEGYLNLVASIARAGVLNPINVRERTATIDDEEITYYELVDGLHRFTASKDAGQETIPINVVTADDAEVLELQIMGNVIKIENKPVEYSRQLTRIFAGNPTLTVSEMASRLCKSPTWVSQRLGLLKLDDNVAEAVDDGKIAVSNAVALAKLPREEQATFVEQAMVMAADEFVPTVQARAKELRDARRQGRKAEDNVFTPIARVRKLGDLKDECSAPSIAPQLVEQQGVTNPVEAFTLGVAWAISLDPSSITVQRAANDEKRANAELAKQKRAIDRENKKAAEAAKAAAEIAEKMQG